jgi:hypothetical protein
VTSGDFLISIEDAMQLVPLMTSSSGSMPPPAIKMSVV